MSSGITIVCREVCRQTGAVTAYVCKKDVEDRDLRLVGIRGRISPELQYYAIRTCVADNTEELEDLVLFISIEHLKLNQISSIGMKLHPIFQFKEIVLAII